MNSIDLNIGIPWLLLLLIPAIGLALWPYLRMSPKKRRTRNRIVSLALHISMVSLAVLVLSGFTYDEVKLSIKDEVVILVDGSFSNQESAGRIDQMVADIVNENAGEYDIGVVVFGKNCVYVSPLGGNPQKTISDYRNNAVHPDMSATDIAGALSFVQNLFSEPQRGRIILMSDGIETDGNSLMAAKALSTDGTRLDVIYFNPMKTVEEVSIIGMETPPSVLLNTSVQIEVTVKSARSGYATLSLYDYDDKLNEQSVFLSGGVDTITLYTIFHTPSLHMLKATVSTPNDAILENNVYYSYVNILQDHKVLIVDGGNNSQQIESLIGESLNVFVVDVDNLPASLSELRQYDEVILMNVKNVWLRERGFDLILSDYVRLYGGGLLYIGGDNAFIGEDIENTLLGEALPVEFRPAEQTVSVMIVIDASASMSAGVAGSNKTRLQVAQSGAIDCINLLKDNDYVGVVSFQGGAPTKRSDLVAATNKAHLLSAINEITHGGGTNYDGAIQMAGDMLKASNLTDLKHILFLTDGDPTAGNNYGAMVEGYAKAGISFSAVVVLGEPNMKVAGLKKAVEVSGGNYFETATGTEVPEFMMQDTMAVIGARVNPVQIFPKIASISDPAVSGVISLPELYGYYGLIKAKDKAVTVVEKGNVPLYVSWEYGLGNVGCFMSDLDGTWSEQYFIDNRGLRFVGNIVNSLLPVLSNVGNGDLAVEFVNFNYTRGIRVTTSAGPTDYVSATVTSPAGNRLETLFTRQSETIFEAVLAFEEAGVYQVELSKKDRTDKVIAQFTAFTGFSYSSEYEGFADEAVSRAFMEKLYQEGGGAAIFQVDGMFSDEAQSERRHVDPRYALITSAIVLFLLDIASRKFKFKWPNEWFKKGNAGESIAAIPEVQ